MTFCLQDHGGKGSSRIATRALFVCVVSITLLGFYLRYRCLGCLGFRWDEDLTALAVKALIEKGTPELPSGMVYLRFFPVQWLTGISVKLFGFSEFSMRLPAVIFGTVLIPAAYFVAARLFSKPIGIIIASCIALSFWQVEMARTARMYAPFFLAYLGAAYAIYRAHYEDLDNIFSPWVPLLALVALSIHQLAYSLSILLLVAIPLRHSFLRTVSLVLQAVTIGLAFVAVNFAQQWYFQIPRRAADAVQLSQHSDEGTGLVAALVRQVLLPVPNFLHITFDAFPIITSVAMVAVIVAGLFVARAVSRQGVLYLGLTWVAMTFSIMHQFNLVGMTLIAMLMALKNGLSSVRNPAWYWPALLCFSIFLLWLATIGMFTILPPSDVLATQHPPRQMLRTLFDYPNFRLFWSYVLERPLLSVPLALGSLWGINKISSDRPDPKALFLFGGFWLVLFANGVLSTKFEFFRYNLHVDPIFLMLVTVGLFSLPQLLEELELPILDRLKLFLSKPIGTLAVATVVILGINPVGAVLTSDRDYSEGGFPYTSLGLGEYPDFKTPAEFVRDRYQLGDIILVLDPREYWNYIGRVHYWIRSTDFESQTYQNGGRAYDMYLGIPLLHSKNQVKDVLENRADGTAWILFSKSHLARTPSVSDSIKAYLKGLDDKIVYVGRDGQTVVVRISK